MVIIECSFFSVKMEKSGVLEGGSDAAPEPREGGRGVEEVGAEADKILQMVLIIVFVSCKYDVCDM